MNIFFVWMVTAGTIEKHE